MKLAAAFKTAEFPVPKWLCQRNRARQSRSWPMALLRKLRPISVIAAGAAVLWLLFPFGYPTYDTEYALLWGHELAHGVTPDYGAPLPPTPHPLADLWGLLASPLGSFSAAEATTALAYLALAALVYLVYRLGALWFDRAIGAVGAAIVITRYAFLTTGVLAYVDLPFLVLILAALLIETRRPRAGWPVLAPLALAGLLRPEAMLFSVAYLGFLLLEDDPTPGGYPLRRRAGLDQSHVLGWVLLAAAAPVAWALFDLITTGDPTHSFTSTHETARTLQRPTGVVDFFVKGPGLVRAVLGWPAVVGATIGLPLCLVFLTRRSWLGAIALALALAAFGVLGVAGLPIISRYTLLAAALLAIFAAAGLLGWRLLADGHPWRRPWQAFGTLLAVLFAISLPSDIEQLSSARTELRSQSRVMSEFHDLVSSVRFQPGCGRMSVPNYRAVPLVASWLDLRPTQVVDLAHRSQPSHGYVLRPVNQFVVHNLLLNLHDPRTLKVGAPPGFQLLRANRFWKIYAQCR
jgi:hypothetical protein